MAVHAALPEGPVTARPSEAMSRGMMGMVLFICSEIMLFGALFAAFFFVHNQASVWPPEGVEKAKVGLAAVLTVLLVSSSLAAHFGILGIKSGSTSQLRLGVGLAILLGTLFIAGQIYEWFNLF